MLHHALSWYEGTLPVGERKRRGHFSTPPLLVEQILDACGYTAGQDLSSIRVLDPACGSGNFLAGAAHCLLQCVSGGDATAALTSVQRNLWGFDPDPVACFLAEMQLRTILAGAGQPLPASARLHIHQGDGLALPWEPCIDLLVANPPYLAAKNSDLSGYRSAQQRGQADSYLLFLNLALQVVRPNGWIGLVLPDPVLARANAAGERLRVLEQLTLHHLWHLSGVFAAQVGAVVLIAQKCPPANTHAVSWQRAQWLHDQEAGVGKPATVPQSLFLRQPGGEFRYLLSGTQGATIERLRAALEQDMGAQESQRLAPLSTYLAISRGEELGREHPHLVRTDEGCPPAQEGVANWCPVLRGGIDVRPYETPESAWWIAMSAIAKPLERYTTPKLLVVKSTGSLQAALDRRGHVALQTLYLLHLRAPGAAEDDLYFFLALLNSHLLRHYLYMLLTAYKWVQPQIEQHVLARLPIPVVSPAERSEIIARAKLLVQIHDHPPTGYLSRVGFLGDGNTGEPSPLLRTTRAYAKNLSEQVRLLYEEQEQAIMSLYSTAL